MSSDKLKDLIYKITSKNEAEANIIVAKVMRVTLYVFCLVYCLNLLGIFVINQRSMTITFFLSAVILLVPTLLNKLIKPENKWLKYIYVILAELYIFLAGTTLTYHAIIAFIYPVVIASIYFNLSLTKMSILLTCVTTIMAQLLGYQLNLVHDANFNTPFAIIVFSIIPKCLCLYAISKIVLLLTKRTDKLLKEQIKNTHEIITLNNEMIVGFVTLVESKDNSTGGHITRTSCYAELLAKELRDRGLFKDEITDDFIENIKTAAPMHDIGKIGIPDKILQKPGKLTPEEFDIMKTHSTIGGKFLLSCFSHIGNEQFRKIALEIAFHHHEKWNGNGYPDGLAGTDIPLSARIMSIADVFDAVSESRCYRPAMSLDESFAIIEKGSGTDFDATIAETFLSLKPQIEKIHKTFM